MSMRGCFVGFDTSNYTTSAAICTEDGEVVANLKIPLSVKEGERGLRQSDAVFFHVRNLPVLCERLQEALNGLTPLAIGVSTRPRDVADSYMPCFLSGKAAASSFAAAANIPLFEFSHQNGHIMAALYSSGAYKTLLASPFLSFHVSGGTTEGLFVEPLTQGGFSVSLEAKTADINAGQAIDRVGVMMGLSFPCGRELEQLAKEYKGKPYRHPISVCNGKCSLSGAENIAARLYRETGDCSAVAAFVFDFIGRTLDGMSSYLVQKHGDLPILYAGGVMSNQLMRQALSERYHAYFAHPAFSADNAAGVALLCRQEYQRKLS